VIELNLLETGSSASRRLRAVLLLCLLGGAGMVSIDGTMLYRRSSHLRARADEARAALATFAPRVAESAELQARLATREAQRAAMTRLRAERWTTADFVSAIPRAVPAVVSLAEIRRRGPTVQIEGTAASLTAIAELARELSGALSFARPPVIQSVTAEGEKGSRFRFQIAAELPLPERTAAR
jgi:Tfp pilus assembly protein PilN